MLIDDLLAPKLDKVLSKNHHSSNQRFWDLAAEEKINPKYQTEEEMFQLQGMPDQL